MNRAGASSASLNDVRRSTMACDAHEPEISPVQQIREFALRALAATAEEEQHRDVDSLAEMSRVPRRHDHFEDEKPAFGWDRMTDDLENRRRVVIVPIMQHTGQDVDVTPGWYGSEDVAFDCLASFLDTGFLGDFSRPVQDLGLIYEDSLQMRVCAQYGAKRLSGTAGNINDGLRLLPFHG